MFASSRILISTIAVFLNVGGIHTVLAVTCLAPYPVGAFGDGICGPQKPAIEVVDDWGFPYKQWGWCKAAWFSYPCWRTRVDHVSFTAACRDHDECYVDSTNCNEKIDACNSDFDLALDQQCSVLPHACQRSWCDDILTTAFIGVLDVTDDAFDLSDNAGC